MLRCPTSTRFLTYWGWIYVSLSKRMNDEKGRNICKQVIGVEQTIKDAPTMHPLLFV